MSTIISSCGVDLPAAQIEPWGLRVPQVEIMLPHFSLTTLIQVLANRPFVIKFSLVKFSGQGCPESHSR